MSRVWAVLKSNPYGWVIVFVAALAMVATLPGRTHGLSMITERLLADPAFELNRISYADMNLWATLLGGLFCLPCGYLIDRYGLKITLAVTVVSLGIVVVGMTHISGQESLFVALILTRGFGQSALSIISISMVGKWFGGRQTLPMAIYTVILSFGFGLAGQLAKPYAASDWRVLWGGIGWIVLLVMTPLALLLVSEPKSRPVGDNNEPQPDSLPVLAAGAVPKESIEIGFTLVQALQTQAFWAFGLAISVIALIGSGTSLFSESVLAQQGFPKEVFYNLLTLSSTVGLFLNIPIGWLGLHVAPNRLYAMGLFLMTTCLLGLPYIHTDWGITIYGIGMGISGCITTVLFFSIWGEAFGRARLGQIQSVAQMMTVLASSAGPKVFAECFATYGSYAPAFRVLAGVVALLGVWLLVIRVPTPSDAPQAVPNSLNLETV
jgi:MFS family permease